MWPAIMECRVVIWQWRLLYGKVSCRKALLAVSPYKYTPATVEQIVDMALSTWHQIYLHLVKAYSSVGTHSDASPFRHL